MQSTRICRRLFPLLWSTEWKGPCRASTTRGVFTQCRKGTKNAVFSWLTIALRSFCCLWNYGKQSFAKTSLIFKYGFQYEIFLFWLLIFNGCIMQLSKSVQSKPRKKMNLITSNICIKAVKYCSKDFVGNRQFIQWRQNVPKSPLKHQFIRTNLWCYIDCISPSGRKVILGLGI